MSISNIKFQISRFLILFAILAFTFLFFSPGSIKAQATPFPAPAPIPCNPITAALPSNPEFNSLRPYQASPCQTSVAPTAKYCGNTLNLQVSINQPYTPGTSGCQTNGGTITCNYSTSENFPVVTIDLTGANLPFLGNTEDVLNSQSASESATNAQKVNEYVSWYLNGVINRAEYGDTQNTPDNLINYSGPINKLLPGIVLDAQRIKSVDNVAVNTNHNQIVVCAQSSILGEIANILNINVKTQPQGCYQGNGSPAPATTPGDVYRLNDWSGQNNLSFWNTIANQIVNFVTLPLGLDPNLRNLVLSSFSDHWNQREPPLPWGKDQHGQTFTDLTYQKAYNEWQGKTCAIIPIVNLLVCLDNFLVPNKYAELFQYVPLSSTEDVKGNVSVDTSSIAQNVDSQVNIANPKFSGQTPADLFYAHAVESDQLATLLQSTYVAQGIPQNGTSSDVSTAACNNVEVRTNKGDNLFAKQITGNLSFTANFSCTFETDAQMIQEGKCTAISTGKEMQYACPTQSCTKVASIDLSTVSQSPELDDIWSRLVAGPEAIFKMIFPKTNTTGSVGQIIDISGATNITYSGTSVTSSDTQLKLPHLGGIYEYFLKGIQTALRPKGYGDPIDFGQTNNLSGDVCAVAAKYNIPCCQLQGIMQVETGNGALIGSGSCTRNGKIFSCCYGNFCGPANISCSQYSGLTDSDNLDMCTQSGSAELLARAMLLSLCQADANTGKIPAGTCNSYDWSTWGNYVLQHYSIQDENYTAAAYFYGLGHGCAVDACSQFRWGAGKGYCDAVQYYCDKGTPLADSTDGSFCNACNATIPASSPKIDCSQYP
jgi:hypothetical protein